MFEILSLVFFVLLVVSIYFNIKFGIIILNCVDAIEEGLDRLDEKYGIFAKILEKPVFFDSVEVRQVIQEIKSSQDLLLSIANNLSQFGRSKNEED
jgi:hypothetical protein